MEILTALICCISFALFLSHKHTQAQLKREQRERIRMALRLKRMEQAWANSDLEKRLISAQNQINALTLKR